MRVVLLSLLIASAAAAQDTRPMADEPDAHYFDFWIGTWQKLVDGKVEPDGTMFRVEKGAHPAAFEETWRMRLEPNKVMAARAFRAWDKTNRRWMFVWVSDNGLFQVWEGRKVGDRWYIYKEFDIDGDRYLSRQGFFPAGADEVERVSEKSYDQGKTWQLRFRERYRKSNR